MRASAIPGPMACECHAKKTPSGFDEMSSSVTVLGGWACCKASTALNLVLEQMFIGPIDSPWDN